MPLPFLKNKEGGAAGPAETLQREPDEAADYDVLDAVVDDLMAAFAAQDRTLLKSAIESLVDHIQAQDVVQDELTNEGV